jgi:5-methyltetrahydrofolate--homocysteine methyltransferase
MKTKVSSVKKEVIIGDDQPTVLIGERINPAGKKKFQEALKANNLEIVCKEALNQAQAGADILDVCVGTFGVDEVALLSRAVQVVMDTIDIPLCLDSANPKALESALKICKGKPLVNSVSGEERSLSEVLPLVKEYGAAVIGLVQDD